MLLKEYNRLTTEQHIVMCFLITHTDKGWKDIELDDIKKLVDKVDWKRRADLRRKQIIKLIHKKNR